MKRIHALCMRLNTSTDQSDPVFDHLFRTGHLVTQSTSSTSNILVNTIQTAASPGNPKALKI